MKKLLLLLLVSSGALLSSAQPSKWFLSVKPGLSIGGPSGSLYNRMEEQGFNKTRRYDFWGLKVSTPHPIKSNTPSILLQGGFKQNEKRSIYFACGIAGGGEVTGYASDGNMYNNWLYMGTEGQTISVDYTTYQLSAGYQYAYSNTRVKLSAGPTIFLLAYTLQDPKSVNKHLTAVPAASFNIRLPMGKEKRLVGFDLFADAHLALPAKMKEMNSGSGSEKVQFKPGSVNMMQASIGIACSFRR